jgi:SAM-dependent methyltransferase
VESIVNFGCCSSEPFLLLWALDAVEIVVVEKEAGHLTGPKEDLKALNKVSSNCLGGRPVEFIVADMSTRVTSLPSDRFDLAYCRDVLYDIYTESDLQRVQSAISEMARVVKPGRWVIAVEPKIGVEFEEVADDLSSRLSGHKMTRHFPVSAPKDISSLFEAAGLDRDSLYGAPDWSYCYKKRHG